MDIEDMLVRRRREEARRDSEDESGSRRRLPPIRKYVLLGATALAAIILAYGSYYTVSPTEVAGVRQFGKLESVEPVGPGFHLKEPFIESVDYLQTSISKFGVNNLKVYTVDNQPIVVNVNMTYQIPKNDAFHLMYDVGKAGNFDLWNNIEPVISGVVAQIFSQENTVSISEDRAALNAKITQQVQAAIGPMFGIQVKDLQITGLEYGQAFEQSISQAVMAKNAAIQAENHVNQVRYEADQAKIKAEGTAQAAIAQAQGDSQAAILKAEGEAKATELTGEAQAKAIEAVGAAVAQNPQIVRFEIAKRWNGSTPQFVMGDKGAVPLLNLQVPQNQQAAR